MVGFPALLVDCGHKNSAYQVNLLGLLLPAMLDLSHINAWKVKQAAVNEGISIPSLPVLQSYKRLQVPDTMGKNCAVPGCTSKKKNQDEAIHLFSFPRKSKELMTKWMRLIP